MLLAENSIEHCRKGVRPRAHPIGGFDSAQPFGDLTFGLIRQNVLYSLRELPDDSAEQTSGGQLTGWGDEKTSEAVDGSCHWDGPTKAQIEEECQVSAGGCSRGGSASAHVR